MKSNFDIKSTLSKETSKQKIEYLLQFAILAPSTHNTQPWLVHIEGDSCNIYLDNSKQLPAADPVKRNMYISLGAFIKNLEIAASAYDIKFTLDYRIDEKNIAEFKFINLDKDNKLKANFKDKLSSIQTRYNYRGPFKALNVEEINKVKSILNSESSDNVKVNFIQDTKVIETLANATANGLRQAYGTEQFRKEISSWIRSNISSSKDGIPGYALRMNTLQSLILPKIMKHKNIGDKLAGLNYNSFITSSAVTIISSSKNSPSDWLEVGRIAQACFIELENNGFAYSIYVAAIEMNLLTEQEKKTITQNNNQKPQFLFCIGKAVLPRVVTPRLPLAKKLI
jgi:hypothetical protein